MSWDGSKAGGWYETMRCWMRTTVTVTAVRAVQYWHGESSTEVRSRWGVSNASWFLLAARSYSTNMGGSAGCGSLGCSVHLKASRPSYHDRFLATRGAMRGMARASLSTVQSGPPHSQSQMQVPSTHVPRPLHPLGHHSREQSAP